MSTQRHTPTSGQISPESRSHFRSGLHTLLGINAVSFALSMANEVLVGHSALGFNQASMELVDTGLAVGLSVSEKNDVASRHKKASRIRQGLYGMHIAIAGLGITEAIRLIDADSEPSVANIAISGIVGSLNANYLYHRLRHHRNEAHTTAPTYETAMSDPLEVIQDELHNLPTAEEVHKMNDNGTTAIAWTNVTESFGGLAGAGMQMAFQQGGAYTAIASSAAVIGIMANQIRHEHKVRQRMR